MSGRGRPADPVAVPEIQHTALDGGPHHRPLTAAPVNPVGVDPITLWIGALATALVCGLVSIVGVITARTIPGVDLIGPRGASYVPVVPWHLTAGAVLAVLAGASLLHLLLLLSPRPLLFFRCVALLVTATMSMWPFTTHAGADSKLVSAVVYLSIGLSVTGLLTVVSEQSR